MCVSRRGRSRRASVYSVVGPRSTVMVVLDRMTRVGIARKLRSIRWVIIIISSVDCDYTRR